MRLDSTITTMMFQVVGYPAEPIANDFLVALLTDCARQTWPIPSRFRGSESRLAGQKYGKPAGRDALDTLDERFETGLIGRVDYAALNADLSRRGLPEAARAPQDRGRVSPEQGRGACSWRRRRAFRTPPHRAQRAEERSFANRTGPVP